MSRKGKFWVIFIIIAMGITYMDIFTNWINPFVGNIGLFMLIVIVLRMMYILYIQRKEEVGV